METLLAIDLGVKTGWASYSQSGKLLDYGSHNYGNASRLKKAVYPLLTNFDGLHYLVIEGGGKLTKYWVKVARQLDIEVTQTHAHAWRKDLFRQKNMTNTKHMKQHAEEKAREIIEDAGLSQPKRLKHDAAEAIMIGYWACLQAGWIKDKK